jgi:hypothetical protein
MDDEESQHLKQLREAHLDRLRYLEQQEARRGIDTPADVLMEIKDKQAKIAYIDAQLGAHKAQITACRCHEGRLVAAMAVLDGAISAVEAMLTDIPNDAQVQALLAFIRAEQQAVKVLVNRHYL